MISLNNLLNSIIIAILCAFSLFSAVKFNYIAIVVACFMCEIGMLLLKNSRVKLLKIQLVWLINVVLMFVYAVSFSQAVIYYNIMLFILVLLSIVTVSQANILSTRTVIKIVYGFCLISLLLIVVESVFKNSISPIISLFLSGDNLTYELNRISRGTGYRGLAEFPNVLSIAGAVLLFFSIYFRRNEKKFKLFFALVVSLIGIALTNERSNIIIIPAVIFLVYIVSSQKNVILKYIRVLLTIGILVSLLFIFKPYLSRFAIFERVFTSIASFIQGSDITNGRSLLTASALYSWKKSPIIGNGWFYYYYNNRGILTRNTLVHAHNVFLELMCDVGILGLIIVMFPFVISLINNIRALRYIAGSNKGIYQFTLAIQLYFILDSMLHVTFYSINMVFFYFLSNAIFYATILNEKENIKTNRLLLRVNNH